MRKISILAVFLLFLMTSLANVQASDIKYSPTAEFYVNDFANILSDQVKQEIYNISRTIEESTTAQLVVVTVPNINGYYIESYANILFNKWKIGSKEKDNGILLIIAKEERKIRIEVGYGLEGAINDAKAGRILDKFAVIPLREDNYDIAIINTVKQLQSEIYKEYGKEIPIENSSFVPIEDYELDILQIVIVIVVFIFLAIITKGKIFEYLFWILVLCGKRR